MTRHLPFHLILDGGLLSKTPTSNQVVTISLDLSLKLLIPLSIPPQAQLHSRQVILCLKYISDILTNQLKLRLMLSLDYTRVLPTVNGLLH